MRQIAERVLEWRVEEDPTDRSLHDFIAEEVNPLLTAGWTVRDVRIEGPAQGVHRCRLSVVLAGRRAQAASPAL